MSIFSIHEVAKFHRDRSRAARALDSPPVPVVVECERPDGTLASARAILRPGSGLARQVRSVIHGRVLAIRRAA